MEKKYKVIIRQGLSVINIVLIILLSVGIIFIGAIDYLREQDGEYKEVVTNLEEPYITWSGGEIISFPLLVGIVLLATNKKKKIVDAVIEISNDKIVIKYSNKIYTINNKNIKQLKYNYDTKTENFMLSFRGNNNMLVDNKNKNSNSYDLTFKENIDELCNQIIKTTNIKIKNFDN